MMIIIYGDHHHHYHHHIVITDQANAIKVNDDNDDDDDDEYKSESAGVKKCHHMSPTAIRSQPPDIAFSAFIVIIQVSSFNILLIVAIRMHKSAVEINPFKYQILHFPYLSSSSS